MGKLVALVRVTLDPPDVPEEDLIAAYDGSMRVYVQKMMESEGIAQVIDPDISVLASYYSDNPEPIHTSTRFKTEGMDVFVFPNWHCPECYNLMDGAYIVCPCGGKRPE